MDFKVADRFTMEWEAELIRQLLAYAQELEDEQEGFKLHISITRSFADVSVANLNLDIALTSAGYVLMFVYAMVMLSKFNVVEQRAQLTGAGIGAIGMGIMVSLGLTMLL